MTDQSIEDASRIDHLDMVLAANRAVGCNRPQSCDYFTGDFNLTVFLEEMLKLIEARQSSQSEPVAYRWYEEKYGDYNYSDVPNPHRQCEAVYAAPQQAIPSGYAIVPIEPTEAMLDEIHLVHEFSREALKARYKAMLSASPTAPIERDK
jgi:hypothetical protein